MHVHILMHLYAHSHVHMCTVHILMHLYAHSQVHICTGDILIQLYAHSCTQEEEERIRRQAMMEIMVEGDKLSKAERSQSYDKSFNMAQVCISLVCACIVSCVLICVSREFLGNISFPAATPQSMRTGYTSERVGAQYML